MGGKAALTDELESEDDFQQDRDPRRGEERPGSSHGIAPSDANTGAQPGDQVHQGTVAPLPLRNTPQNLPRATKREREALHAADTRTRFSPLE